MKQDKTSGEKETLSPCTPERGNTLALFLYDLTPNWEATSTIQIILILSLC